MVTTGENVGLPRNIGTILLLVLLWVLPSVGSAQEVGPARGALIVSGGGATTSHIIDRFIELAGGPDAPIVVVPTSGRSDEDYHEYCPCLRRWREAGATNLTVMHTRDREEANTDEFVEPLRQARGIWFRPRWTSSDTVASTDRSPGYIVCGNDDAGKLRVDHRGASIACCTFMSNSIMFSRVCMVR